ncbi:MAG: hypothetical protein U9N54_06455 [candidate division Zixibacteria bacterium]|nr:hypothetical protein [candidate division Zixibacteria bacterium]
MIENSEGELYIYLEKYTESTENTFFYNGNVNIVNNLNEVDILYPTFKFPGIDEAVLNPCDCSLGKRILFSSDIEPNCYDSISNNRNNCPEECDDSFFGDWSCPTTNY